MRYVTYHYHNMNTCLIKQATKVVKTTQYHNIYTNMHTMMAPTLNVT